MGFIAIILVVLIQAAVPVLPNTNHVLWSDFTGRVAPAMSDDFTRQLVTV